MQLDLLDLQLAASIRGDMDEAWRLSEILSRERPEDNRAAFNRSWHLFHQGDFKGGMALAERGRLEGVFGSKPLNIKAPRWTGEDLQNKTILLRGEGGFGDEIVGARFAQLLADRGARVVASVSPGLVSLATRVAGVSQTVARGKEEEEAAVDYWVPAMSTPIPLDLDYATLPSDSYLSADPVYVEKWRKLLGEGGYKVGIRWSGNPQFEHEQFRRFPPEPLFALADIPGVTLYSLQRDHDLRDLRSTIVDLQHMLESWQDTAAAIANLDLVITSCTSIAHLAAAMGKETWIIIPALPYYLWAMPGERSPWYKSVRLFRQEVFGNWDAPLAAVEGALKERMQHTTSKVPTTPAHQAFAPRALYSREAETAGYAAAGIYLAPRPTGGLRAPHNTTHFVSGLPRSGSGVLLSILAQNPRIMSAPTSGMCDTLIGLSQNWDKMQAHRDAPDPGAKKRILTSVLEQYHQTERPLIFDRSYGWPLVMDLLERLLERPIKMIVMVRSLPEILASFEMAHRADPLVVASAGAPSTIESRALDMATGGELGVAYRALRDAVTRGYLDRMLFVDYNKFVVAPKMQLRRIYEFLEEPYFEHDVNRIEPLSKEVRKELKKGATEARQILGDVYSVHDQPQPWRSWV